MEGSDCGGDPTFSSNGTPSWGLRRNSEWSNNASFRTAEDPRSDGTGLLRQHPPPTGAAGQADVIR